MGLVQTKVRDGYSPERHALFDSSYSGEAESLAPGEIQIRKYQKKDRDAVRWICCETGFMGRPIDLVYRDRELFADLITAPYLEHEPEWALVAERDGQVVGYLLGSVNPHFNLSLMRSGFHTARKMLTKLVTGRYADHPRSEQFVRWVLTRGFKERPKHPENAAHLHLNLEKAFRGRDVGKRIWTAFEDKLRAAGVDHYYGEFFSHRRRRPERIYARAGFQVYDRQETTIFYPEIRDTVEVVCVHKRITSGNVLPH